MNKNFISIVTIVKNNRYEIEKTLISCINQKNINFEYIVIDAESSDGTSEIISNYKNNITHYIRESDKGIYDAMNKAIDIASGDWIIFMNCGDVFYTQDTLSRIFKNNLDDYLVLAGSWCESDKIDKILNPNNQVKYGMIACHQSMLVKTKVIKDYKFNTNYKIAADYDFFLKIITPKSKKIFISTEIIAIINPIGLGRNKELYHIEYSDIIFRNFGFYSYFKYIFNHLLVKYYGKLFYKQAKF